MSVLRWLLPSHRAAFGPPTFLVVSFLLAGFVTADLLSPLFSRLTGLTRDSIWEQTDVFPLDFDTHHPQGFARAGDFLFLSTVEVLESPQPLPDAEEKGPGRTVGAGRGWLIKMTLDGEFVASTPVGEGTLYHPGGIDFDGTWLWVPVAEYRPDSRSTIYRIHPETLEMEAVISVDDHIGGVAHDLEKQALYGVNWGARKFYTWSLDNEDPDQPVESTVRTNPSHYIDYQDCQSLGKGMAVCTGLSSYTPGENKSRFALGGLEVINFRTGQPIYQVPITLWTEGGRVMTQNPSHFEIRGDGIRAYFMPEDQPSRLYIFQAGH